MARSWIKRRQETERARVEAYEASLRRVSQRERPAPDFEQALLEAKRGFETDIVRESWTWRPRMKTRDPGRLRLAAARHLFSRYPVAEHLEQIWLRADGLGPDEIRLRKHWYVVAAGGGSLYKAGANAWLSRKEVHAFLNPIGRVSFDEAIWLAIARSYTGNTGTGDTGVALRIARSRLSQSPRAEFGFWRDVARFFAMHPTSLEEMDDLRDFIAECYRQNRDFSLKGRTLASLGRRMREWHRDLAEIDRIEAIRRRAERHARAHGQYWVEEPAAAGGHWPGVAIADWSWTPSAKERWKREEFVVVQLRTAADLVAETRAMHHCVASYAGKCIAGHASIWSLRHRANGATTRLLTIELDSGYRAIQVRGFANRPAHADERKILERWSKARGIELS